MDNVKITYGRVPIEGYGLCGVAKYEDTMLICPPYHPLIVMKGDKQVKPTTDHVLIWTKVAGWIGTTESLNQLRRGE